MQNTRKKTSGNEDSKKKERHIVTWTQEEDDILRQQINIHGTENWAIIASKFKDKTTRQCRRRWYTYLNSDFKKGGWSPEEDLLLCEAQKIFGNRWTEIAKVVSGRTDNAVKNRFSTLCKKRAKYEALAKENTTSYMNSNNKRVIFRNGLSTDGTSETSVSTKRIRRSHISDPSENCNFESRLHKQCRATTTNQQQLRAPFAVLVQNSHNINIMPSQHHDNITKDVVADAAQINKYKGSFLRKDDPKINALMQQAELLSSLALKVNTENTEQSLENAWKVLQDFLNQSKESDILRYKLSDFDFQLEDFKDLLDDLKSSNEGSRPSWRQPDLYDESPDSSEYSTGSTTMSQTAVDKTDHSQAETGAPHQDVGCSSQSIHVEESCVGECDNEMICGGTTEQAEIIPTCNEGKNDGQVVSALSNTEFGSPIHVTPMFRSLTAGIPSPKFSESERNFLLKTLGVESPCPGTNPSQPPPPCKRALLHSL
ncbi:transcription factor MYB124 isoform X1 [Cannabis sativa]|uniref:transcription factor MYB124 isoform X1 n=1 Tax=Cannabis sativa TaxID=3483 RepID=UPI0029C9EFA6|nr:transcription factor MYB124 isoform X1 [Cannabis sativa]